MILFLLGVDKKLYITMSFPASEDGLGAEIFRPI